MAEKSLVVLPGDGVGPEVVREGLKVLRAVEAQFGHHFTTIEALAGGAALDAYGVPLTQESLALCRQSDAVLLGAVGDPKWEKNPPPRRPEQALLTLRKELDVFANLRPATMYSALVEVSPLKRDVVEGVDLLVVRELTGGIYFGTPRGFEKIGEVERAFNTLEYRTSEIRRIAEVAFERARQRRRKVTSVDKANILEVSQLWRRVVTEVARDYPDVELEHLYIDNAAMQLIRRPRDFDVVLADNLFGDILSDEAAMLCGSIGMLPSASLGDRTGLYEPVHGTAPDIAGKNIANPIATIASVAMMLRYSFKLDAEADAVERAIERVLAEGYRTQDIFTDGMKLLSTSEMGDAIAATVRGAR